MLAGNQAPPFLPELARGGGPPEGWWRGSLLLSHFRITKKTPQTPPTGRHPMRGFRMPADLEAKLDAWIERQPDPKPSRSEAIRRLLEKALDAAG